MQSHKNSSNPLSGEERYEILDEMLSESWEEDYDWNQFSSELVAEWNLGKWPKDVSSSKYDPLLFLFLNDKLLPVTNEYLRKQLGVDSVYGTPAFRYTCPCCGRKTLDELGGYNICAVCWWEDDGTDNHCDKGGGPNRVNLKEARYNFILHGLCKPARTDLLALREPEDKYEVGRVFKIEGEYLIEQDTSWKRLITKLQE